MKPMPLLTGPEIAKRVREGSLKIEPFDPANVNPNSYNLRLHDELLVYEKNFPMHEWHRKRLHLKPFSFRSVFGDSMPVLEPHRKRLNLSPFWFRTDVVDNPPPVLEPLDMAVDEKTVKLTIPKEGLVLWPGVLYLGSTLEYTESPGVAPKIDGRSSTGRLGMEVHFTAGFGDDNFKGDWTLEIGVIHPLRVYAGVPICQIAYSTLEGERQLYDGRYQGQRGPKPSGLWKSFKPGA
jgi:dCTP deaminase